MMTENTDGCVATRKRQDGAVGVRQPSQAGPGPRTVGWSRWCCPRQRPSCCAGWCAAPVARAGTYRPRRRAQAPHHDGDRVRPGGGAGRPPGLRQARPGGPERSQLAQSVPAPRRWSPTTAARWRWPSRGIGTAVSSRSPGRCPASRWVPPGGRTPVRRTVPHQELNGQGAKRSLPGPQN